VAQSRSGVHDGHDDGCGDHGADAQKKCLHAVCVKNAIVVVVTTTTTTAIIIIIIIIML
jgi:hypothetical protein